MRVYVCLTRQFCILIHRQNWPLRSGKYEWKFTTSVHPSVTELGFVTSGRSGPARQKRDSEQKTGFRFRQTGPSPARHYDKGRRSSRSGLPWQKRDLDESANLSSTVAIPELQAHQQDSLPCTCFPFLCVRHEQASGGAPLLHALQPGHATMRHLN